MIGSDFEKIEFTLFGLNLQEPNTLLTDSLLGLLSLYFGVKLFRMAKDHGFYRQLKWFFIIFGLAAFVGGIGHAFYNYLGLTGKIPSWVLGILAVYFIETAMVSVHPDKRFSERIASLSFYKLILLIAILFLVLLFAAPDQKMKLAMLVVIINSFVGVIISAGWLGLSYVRWGLSPHFRYFVIGVLIILPSSLVFLLKINLHPWFDKNDFCHLLLGTGITFFYLGAKRLFNADFGKT